MRRINMLLTALIIVVFFLHGVTGGLQLAGANILPQKALAICLIALISLHAAVSAVLTYRTLRAMRLSGAGYIKDNKLFWVRRISGFAVIAPVIIHLLTFLPESRDPYRLRVFSSGRLVSQLLLVATIALHVLTNIKPLMISFGVRGRRIASADIMLVVSVMLLLFGLAFVIYYLRWAAV